MFEGLRKPIDLIVIVATLLSYGRPIQAIVHAFGLDERTVTAWRDFISILKVYCSDRNGYWSRNRTRLVSIFSLATNW
jgi:hypothetical protein